MQEGRTSNDNVGAYQQELHVIGECGPAQETNIAVQTNR